MTVQVFDSSTYLVDIALGFELVKALSSPKQLIQRLIMTEFKENVNVFSIFKEMLKADDVVVMKTSVNFDLTHQLLLCP
jgi:hypothetical protein